MTVSFQVQAAIGMHEPEAGAGHLMTPAPLPVSLPLDPKR
jgi:hypothetical protein